MLTYISQHLFDTLYFNKTTVPMRVMDLGSMVACKENFIFDKYGLLDTVFVQQLKQMGVFSWDKVGCISVWKFSKESEKVFIKNGHHRSLLLSVSLFLGHIAYRPVKVRYADGYYSDYLANIPVFPIDAPVVKYRRKP